MLGALPSQVIQALIDAGHIRNADPKRIQPASIDLTLSDEIYRVDGVVLPRRQETVAQILKIGRAKKVSFEDPLLCKGVYIVRVNERFKLPEAVYGYANNKSSSGRINLQVRLLVDNVPQFDSVPRGYNGNAWVVISPHSFSVKLSAGEAINQMRFFNTDTRLSRREHEALYEYFPLMYNNRGRALLKEEVLFDKGGGITATIDLSQKVYGYVAESQQEDKVLDYGRMDHKPKDFFKTIYSNKDRRITLNKDSFYIFATKEYITVPSDFSAEMIPYDATKGEFRSHYAGFFDPGFGYGDGSIKGAPGVLEVFPHDNNVIFRDGQPVCKLIYERLATFPTRIYGETKVLKSNYSKQRVRSALSKHFRQAA